MLVYKYKLPTNGYVEIEMPRMAELLYVAEQNGDLCLWALVDPDAWTVMRRFRIAGTGHAMAPSECEHYIGTVLMSGGLVVWHVFEIRRLPKV